MVSLIASRSIFLVTVLLLFCLNANAQSNEAVLSEEIQKLLDSRYQATRCPGLSIAVASNNTIVVSQALGMADIEQEVPMTTRSVHRLASLSKPITGTFIMGLVEEDKLGLDTFITELLPELPEAYQKVTVRHLLSHQAGVRGYRNLEEAFSGAHYPTSREALKSFIMDPLLFEPGSKTAYSTFGFTVLGAAAEEVTGNSFQRLSAEFFSRKHLEGIGLDDPLAIVPNRVRGYLVDPASKLTLSDELILDREYLAGTSGPLLNARAYDASNKYPGGGFVPSAEDLLRFTIAVGTGKVLRRATVAEMWTAQATSDGKSTLFGLGWGVGAQFNGYSMVGFNGGQPTTTTFLRYLPDIGVGVALLCNAEGAQDLPKLLNDVLEITVPRHD